MTIVIEPGMLLVFVFAVVAGVVLSVLRQLGYLPLRRVDLAALGYRDIQENAARDVAAASAAYYSISGQVDALCRSRLEVFRSFKRYVHDLTGEWARLDRDPRIPEEWKDDLYGFCFSCYRGTLTEMPQPFGDGSRALGSQGSGQGTYGKGPR